MASDDKKTQRVAKIDVPKMETVAQLAGVSMMTVSRVLNGKSNVHPETRKKVEETIRRVGYTPNFSARSLASAEAPYLGLAYLNPSSGYLGQFLIGVLAAARTTGLHVILEAFSEDPADWARELAAYCHESRIRGLILPPPLCDDPAVLAAAREIDLPTVRVSPSRHDEQFVSVRIDEYRAAFEMTELLLANGHRAIGFLKGASNQEAATQRFDGFVDAMRQAGYPVNEAWVGDGEFAPGPALEAGRRILGEKDRPTAIFASNDDMAAGVYTAAHQLGLGVPDDLSVVGFDDQPIAVSLWPALTTVHQPIADMAGRAVELLASPPKLTGEKARPDHIFPFKIIERQSVSRRGS